MLHTQKANANLKKKKSKTVKHCVDRTNTMTTCAWLWTWKWKYGEQHICVFVVVYIHCFESVKWCSNIWQLVCCGSVINMNIHNVTIRVNQLFNKRKNHLFSRWYDFQRLLPNVYGGHSDKCTRYNLKNSRVF